MSAFDDLNKQFFKAGGQDADDKAMSNLDRVNRDFFTKKEMNAIAGKSDSTAVSSVAKVPGRDLTAEEIFNQDTTKVGRFMAGAGRRFLDIADAVSGPLWDREKDPGYEKMLDNSGAAAIGSVVPDILGMIATGGGLSALRGIPALAAYAPKLTSAAGWLGKAMLNPQTIPQALAGGATYAGATTPGGIPERTGSAIMGGAGAAAIPTLGAAGKILGGLLRPVTESGQKRVVGDILLAAAGPAGAARLLEQPEIFVPGSMPTAAEHAGKVGGAGLAKLTSGLRSKSMDFANKLESALGGQAEARRAALAAMGGDDATRKALIEAREAAAGPLFSDYRNQKVPPTDILSEILDRPAVKKAEMEAGVSARNRGESIKEILPSMPDEPVNTAAGLLNIRQALDDQIDYGVEHGWGKLKMGAVKDARATLDNWLRKNTSDYAQANDVFAEKSAPINKLDIIEKLREKLEPALNDFGGTGETGANFARALKQGDKIAQQVSGIGNLKLTDVMPDEIPKLRNIGKDLARKQTFQRQMTGPGSNTASNFAITDFLRSALGPLGLPQGWAEAAIPQTIFGPVKAAYDTVAEPRIQGLLGDALLDPILRMELIRNAQKQQAGGLLNATGYFAIPGASIGSAIPRMVQSR